MQHRVAPGDVRIGMFVHGFGGSWFDHPFWFARFEVGHKHLARLHAADVPYVIIDDARGRGPVAAEAEAQPPRIADHEVRPKDSRRTGNVVRSTLPERRGVRGRGSAASGSDAKAQARQLVARSMRVVRDAFARIRSGRSIELGLFEELVTEIVSTSEYCPRTLLEAIRLKQKDDYTHLHSVAVGTLMVNVARQLGRSKAQIYEYGLAGLFHDIGKVRVEGDILDKEGSLTEEEFATVRAHPQHGYDILSATPGIPAAALDACLHHHERPDGKGYPFGLQGEALSEVARLGAICDVYDALTSDRAYKRAWTPADAIAAMWRWEGQFDRDLLFAFMQSIGVFPEGLVVQLDGDRLGLVLAPRNEGQRSRVLVFFCTASGSPLVARDATTTGKRDRVDIISPADPRNHGIAPEHCNEAHLRGVEWAQEALTTLAA